MFYCDSCALFPELDETEQQDAPNEDKENRND